MNTMTDSKKLRIPVPEYLRNELSQEQRQALEKLAEQFAIAQGEGDPVVKSAFKDQMDARIKEVAATFVTKGEDEKDANVYARALLEELIDGKHLCEQNLDRALLDKTGVTQPVNRYEDQLDDQGRKTVDRIIEAAERAIDKYVNADGKENTPLMETMRSALKDYITAVYNQRTQRDFPGDREERALLANNARQMIEQKKLALAQAFSNRSAELAGYDINCAAHRNEFPEAVMLKQHLQDDKIITRYGAQALVELVDAKIDEQLPGYGRQNPSKGRG